MKEKFMSLHTTRRANARSRFAKFGITTLAAIGLSLAAATPALAHDELVGLSPLGSATSGEAPGIQLDFNNEIMDIGAELIAAAADGSSLLEGTPVIEGRSVKQQLIEDIADGEITVSWRVVSSDGHPIQGLIAVTMQSGYPTEVLEAALASEDAEEAEHNHDHDHEADAEHDHHGEVTTQAPGDQNESESDANVPIAGIVAIGVIVAATVAVLVALARRRKHSASGGAK